MRSVENLHCYPYARVAELDARLLLLRASDVLINRVWAVYCYCEVVMPLLLLGPTIGHGPNAPTIAGTRAARSCVYKIRP